MRYVTYTLYIAALIVVNVGVLPQVFSPLWLPTLLLLAVVIAAASVEPLPGLFFLAALSGLWWDLYTGAPPGAFLVGFTLALIVVRLLGSLMLFSQHRLSVLPVFLAAGFAVLQLWLFFFAWLVQAVGWQVVSMHPWLALGASLRSFVVNALILYPLYMVFQFIEGLVVRLERPHRIA